MKKPKATSVLLYGLDYILGLACGAVAMFFFGGFLINAMPTPETVTFETPQAAAEWMEEGGDPLKITNRDQLYEQAVGGDFKPFTNDEADEYLMAREGITREQYEEIKRLHREKVGE